MHDERQDRKVLSDSLRKQLVNLARDHGFAEIRFTPVRAAPNADVYDDWLAGRMHGSMDYLARNVDIRRDPRVRFAEAKTAMAMSFDHAHRRPPRPPGRQGRVARYAWGRDYHNLVGKRLRKLRRALREQGVGSWGGIDTAPILERDWATASGLGFNGKNCMQIGVGRSSWFFLAVLFLDASVAADAPRGDHCGTCRRCLDDCPTDAFVGPRVLDARRCIAYWSIEARGLPPRELRGAFGDWVFGCDACQEVCPHNTSPPDTAHPDLLPRHAWLDLDDIVRSEDAVLMDRFIGTPLRRPGAAGLKRNALIALANVGDDDAIPTIRGALSHPSPVVRGAAVWALGQLGDRGVQSLTDPDPLVTDEIIGVRP
jgi:epoxyqueuosine reductase